MQTLFSTAALFTAITWIASVVQASPVTAPSPPGIPAAAMARQQLAALTVRSHDPPQQYHPEYFPYWSQYKGYCDVSEYVYYRDGSNVSRDQWCAPVSGYWYSPYDGASWNSPSYVVIDHVVPPYDAWYSGAHAWSTARRQQFANDVANPQLVAVTASVHYAKGYKTPDLWKPPLSSYYCTYAKMWVAVKYYYGLSVKAPEKYALMSMLDTCSW